MGRDYTLLSDFLKGGRQFFRLFLGLLPDTVDIRRVRDTVFQYVERLME